MIDLASGKGGCYFIPKQALEPFENGTKNFSNDLASGPIHLSGLNFAGSGNTTSSWCM